MTTTALICGECGNGNYIPDGFNPEESNYRIFSDDEFMCDSCGHPIALSDLTLDEGEAAVMADGVLSVATPA